MPIDPNCVGAAGGPVERSWTSKDCLLYALGVGAGTEELRFSTEKNQQVLPTFAVIEGRRVLVVEDGRAVAREVRTGLRNWEWTEVVSGLEAGEAVITSLDKQGVRAGAAVKATPREARAPAP